MIDPKILERLRELGIEPGDTPRWVDTGPLNAAELPSVKESREALAKLRDVLRAQVEEDLAKIDRAHLELEKLKHGGGA